jgi:hypothetical protein
MAAAVATAARRSFQRAAALPDGAAPPGEAHSPAGSSCRGGVEINAIVSGQPCRGWCPCGWRSREVTGDLYARALWRDHRRAEHGDRS